MNEKELENLVGRLKDGDEQALGTLLSLNRERLIRTVGFRMDARLRGRVDPDDILQEAFIEAAKRLHHFTGDSPSSFFVWLRMVVLQTLIDIHRQHLGAQMRDADREVNQQAGRYSQTTTVSLAANLLGNMTSPTMNARREEMAGQLEKTLDTMNPTDREVLALRHFEELTNSEVAEVLGIEQKAASIRYVRAIRRFKEILEETPGFHSDYKYGI